MFGRKSVQPNLSFSLTDRNQSLKHLFTVKTLAMKQKPKKVKEAGEVKEKAGEQNKKTEKVVKQSKQMVKDGKQIKLVEKDGEKEKFENNMSGKKGCKEKFRKVVEKTKKGEDKENLDEKGYKTIMRPAVSSFISTGNVVIVSIDI